MADNSTPFRPEDIVNFMNNSAKQAAHNAHIRAEFAKLQQQVNNFAKIFEEGYEVPAPKQRLKRGTGPTAQKKAAQKNISMPDDAANDSDPGHSGSNITKKKSKQSPPSIL